VQDDGRPSLVGVLADAKDLATAALRPRTLRRVAGRTLEVVALGLVFVVGTTTALVLHLDSREARAVTRNAVNHALAPLLRGRIIVGEIEHLSTTRARVRHAKILDEHGDQVIAADGIEARIDLLPLLGAIVSGEGPLPLSFPSARVENATVTLRPDDSNVPTLAWTFLPRDPEPSARPGRVVIVDLPQVEVDHARVDGSVGAPIEADVHRVSASVYVRTDEVVTVDVEETGLRLARLYPGETSGIGSYRLRVDLRRETEDEGSRVRMWAGFTGTTRDPAATKGGPIEVSATAELVGDRLDGSLSLPRVRPEALRTLYPFVPLERDARGRVRVHGPVRTLLLDGTFELEQPEGTATVVVDGGLDVGREVRLRLDLDAAALDARTILASAPSIVTDATARVSVTLAGADEPRVRVEAHTEPTLVFGARLPAVDAAFDVVRGRLIGGATIAEEGVSADVGFQVEGGAVSFDADVAALDLGRLPLVAGKLVGAASVRATGSFVEGTLDAKFRGSARGAGTKDGALWIGSAGFSGTVRGPLEAPDVRLSVAAGDVRVSGEALDRVDLEVSGAAARPRVRVAITDAERGAVELDGVVDLEGRTAEGLRFSVERDGERVVGSMARAGFADGVALDGLSVSSPTVGDISGSLRIRGDEIVGDLRGRNVELGRLARLTGLPIPADGRANVDLVMERTRSGRRGRLDVELEDARVLLVQGVGLRISADIEGDVVRGAGYARVVDYASPGAREAFENRGQGALCDGPVLELRAESVEGRLPGPLLRKATWERATGTADLVFDVADLGCIDRRLPRPLRPLALARGAVSGELTVERTQPEDFPSVTSFQVATSGLGLLAKDGSFGTDELDLALRGRLDGRTGELQLSSSLYDEKTLLTAELRSLLDLAALSGDAPVADTLRRSPFSLAFTMPTRSIRTLDSLPSPLAEALPAVDGDLVVSGSASGTFDQPTFVIGAQAFNVRPTERGKVAAEWLPPLTVDFAAGYDPVRGQALAGVSVGVNRQPVAVVNAVVDVDPRVVTGSRTAEELPWRADLTAEFFDLPIHAVPALADREIAGAVSGKIELKDLNRNPVARGELFVPALRVQDEFQRVSIKGEIRTPRGDEDPSSGEPRGDRPTSPSPAATASVIVEITDEEEGKLQVLGTAGVRWNALSLPELDTEAPGRLVVGAARFGIGVFYPFVAGVLTRLEGKLDGGAELEWGRLASVRKGSFKQANLSISDGVAYIPQFGQELRDGKASLVADPPSADGRQVIRLQGVEARGISGRIHGEANVTLDGLELASASGTLGIDEGEEVPITVEGVPLGKARGVLEFAVKPVTRGLDLDVRVKQARFDLPGASSKNVQSLDDAPGIRVNRPEKPAADKRAEDALQYRLLVTVEDAEIRSSMLNLSVVTPKGQPVDLLLSDRLHAGGNVLLDRGSIVLNKKKFEIDEAIVRLRDEDTGNPDVNLTAHWDSPAGSRVFVSYVGLLKPITDDKFRFRSDPPRSQEEIVQLLVFGENEATGVALAGDVIGGNVASSLANDLLSSAFGGVLRDVLAVNVGTSGSGLGYLGAQVAVGDQFTFGGTVEQVEQSRAGSAQSQAGGCGDFFFDYRITRSWSLRGSGAYCDYEDQTGGQTSSQQDGISLGLDVLWQLRY
jgi:translocation and assembly module TamB